MNKQMIDLLYGIPSGIDYTEDLFRLDTEDIPTDRIPKFLALLGGDDEQAAFRAAYVLCGWGQEGGFEYMRDFVMREPHMESGWYEHRLRGYDDTYRFALKAFVGYWAMLSDRKKLMVKLLARRFLNLFKGSLSYLTVCLLKSTISFG